MYTKTNTGLIHRAKRPPPPIGNVDCGADVAIGTNIAHSDDVTGVHRGEEPTLL